MMPRGGEQPMRVAVKEDNVKKVAQKALVREVMREAPARRGAQQVYSSVIIDE